MTVIKERIDRFRDTFLNSDMGIDTFLVLHEATRHYLSGYTGEDNSFEESAGALIITADKLILATDSRFEVQAQNEAPLYEVFCYKQGLTNSLPAILESCKTKTLGIEGDRVSFSSYQEMVNNLKDAGLFVNVLASDALAKSLRLSKSEDEINSIKSALTIAENAFTQVKNNISAGMTELEVAWQMEKTMRESGASGLSFPTIIAAGTNSALPHAIPGERKIKAGEPLLIDWGAKYKHYCSDTTRTIFTGEPDTMFKHIFQVVHNAYQLAVDAIKDGVSAKQVDSIARSHIHAKGFEGKFGHGLGHGVGLEIHEAPRLSPIKNDILTEGMVVTVEPGIYLPEWGGIRLENMIVVRKDGAEVLNQLDMTDVILRW